MSDRDELEALRRRVAELEAERDAALREREDRESALAEKEALLKEVHHRVKNNLQLICSLLNLQAAGAPSPAVAELFADSRNRVRSMALVHENLYRAGNFARVHMATHLENLCAHLQRSYRSCGQNTALDVRAGELYLDIDRAMTCGLIVNELVSNSLKHAFPGDRHGRVEIELRDVDADRWLLTVADDGVGLPPRVGAPNAASLGLQLVDDLVHQLQGKLSTSRERGTAFTIEFGAAPPTNGAS
ncbi:MAG: family ATPase [Labilithrix sp.]|nr:family ATPase [Labilithrix sp.]